jgi:DNA-binding NarL/FixJ family response regulator
MTPSELHVARLAAAGLTNAAIARTRATSIRTVANQIQGALRKLGLPSRRALAFHPDVLPAGQVEPESGGCVDWNKLNLRERALLGQVCRGAQIKAIAIDEGLAPSTVSGVLHAARRKLGFDSLVVLARAYATMGPSPTVPWAS